MAKCFECEQPITENEIENCSDGYGDYIHPGCAKRLWEDMYKQMIPIGKIYVNVISGKKSKIVGYENHPLGIITLMETEE